MARRSRTTQLAIAAVSIVVLFAAPSALAAVRYALPGGNATDPDCLSKAANCSIKHATTVAQDSDEVIVTPGTYDFGASAGPAFSNGINIHGENGQPRPLLTNNSASDTMQALGGQGTAVRNLAFDQKGTGNALVFLGSSGPDDVFIENVAATARGMGAIALVGAFGGHTDIRSSSGYAPGTNGVAMQNSTLLGASNLTLIAPGSGGVAADQRCTSGFFSGCTGDSSAFLINSILNGGTGGTDVRTNAQSCTACGSGTSHTTVSAGNSNFSHVSNCAGCTITTPGANNNQTAPPVLIDAAGGNFRELVNSPTRDAGAESGFTGIVDLDGNPRKLGPAPDIGAFEYNGTPIVNTLEATNIGNSTARLNASVDPRGFDTSFYFQWGTNTTYGNQAPASPGNAGSGVGAKNVFADASGLPPRTLIHYRAVASSAYGGTVFGPDRTFATIPGQQGFNGIRLARLVINVRGGFAIVRVPCPAFALTNCVGRVSLKTRALLLQPKVTAALKKGKKRRLALGSRTFSIAPGKTGTVKIKLTKAGRKLMKVKRTLKAIVTIAATVNGTKRTTSQNVTLKRVGK
jgi:hypothetical protein